MLVHSTQEVLQEKTMSKIPVSSGVGPKAEELGTGAQSRSFDPVGAWQEK